MWYINKNLEKQNQITQIKFYKLMAVPALLYGSEISVLKQNDYSSLTAAEIVYL